MTKDLKKRKKVVLDFTGQKSIVDQSAKDSCDLNVLLKNYNKSQIPIIQASEEIQQLVGVEYQDMLYSVQRAQESFLTLPSAVRARFHHNIQQLLNFLSDEKNYDEAVELGLIVKKQDTTAANPSPAGGEATKKPAKPAKSAAKAATSESSSEDSGQSD